MKVLEKIINILIRIVNIPLLALSIILIVLYSIILLFIISPVEFLTVMPIYYIITGEWYYDIDINPPYDQWFPISGNMETYFNHSPFLIIPEINLSKYYGRDKEHTSL